MQEKKVDLEYDKCALCNLAKYLHAPKYPFDNAVCSGFINYYYAEHTSTPSTNVGPKCDEGDA